MSAKHLVTGSSLPPLKNGTTRLYSMRFCPYAQRSRLALTAKGIPFETVNCNLKQKPEWLLERNPKGLVPVIEHDGKVVYESLIVNDYVDEIYPDQRPLGSKDPYEKARDRMVQDMFDGQVIPNYFKVLSNDGKDREQNENLTKALKKVEDELKKRGTRFFRGIKPGLLDYNMWPFLERIKWMEQTTNLTIFDDSLSVLTPYVERMLSDEAVKAIRNPTDIHVRFFKSYHEKGIYDYDLK